MGGGGTSQPFYTTPGSALGEVCCIADVSSVNTSSDPTLDQQGLIWYVLRRKVCCIADVSSVSPSSKQTLDQ